MNSRSGENEIQVVLVIKCSAKMKCSKGNRERGGGFPPWKLKCRFDRNGGEGRRAKKEWDTFEAREF